MLSETDGNAVSCATGFRVAPAGTLLLRLISLQGSCFSPPIVTVIRTIRREPCQRGEDVAARPVAQAAPRPGFSAGGVNAMLRETAAARGNCRTAATPAQCDSTGTRPEEHSRGEDAQDRRRKRPSAAIPCRKDPGRGKRERGSQAENTRDA